MSQYYLQEGDVIDISEGHEVYAVVPEHFLFDNKKGSWKMKRGGVRIKGELSYLAGRYVVYKTVMDGGGTAHGPGDYYPDGWHVFCEKVDDPDTNIDFYQSGAFTAMITDIKPVGKAKKKWVFENKSKRK